MANSSSVQPWQLQMPLGSLQQWQFAFTTVDASTGQSQPYPITGYTWEYTIRQDASSTGAALVTLTTAAGSDGVLTVTSTASLSQVELDLYPAATSGLPAGVYAHALWSNPGTSSQFCWWNGPLIVTAASQP